MKQKNWRRDSGSTPVVGSSRSRRSGSWISAAQSPSGAFQPAAASGLHHPRGVAGPPRPGTAGVLVHRQSGPAPDHVVRHLAGDARDPVRGLRPRSEPRKPRLPFGVRGVRLVPAAAADRRCRRAGAADGQRRAGAGAADPPDFGIAVRCGETADIAALIDGTDTGRAGTMESYVEGAYPRPVGGRAIDAGAGRPCCVRVARRRRACRAGAALPLQPGDGEPAGDRHLDPAAPAAALSGDPDGGQRGAREGDRHDHQLPRHPHQPRRIPDRQAARLYRHHASELRHPDGARGHGVGRAAEGQPGGAGAGRTPLCGGGDGLRPRRVDAGPHPGDGGLCGGDPVGDVDAAILRHDHAGLFAGRAGADRGHER